MSSMLRKKEVFTIITPIPGFIPRQLAIDILHSHSEVITLNPLVLEHKPIKAPRNAASDEYYSTWYEITERIQYIPGLGRMGSGKISFNGCFHDMPWGLQTHIYAPMNTDLKNKYCIAGNQPGVEPPQQLEIGLGSLGAPSDGLYLRDDVEIKCNLAVVGFVKTQLKAASKEMVSRIIKKAELLDAGVLHAMIDNGKLRTINPNDRSSIPVTGSTSPPQQPSPTFMDRAGAMSPKIDEPQPYQVPRPSSYQQYKQPNQQMAYNTQNPHWSAPYGTAQMKQQQQQLQQQQQQQYPQSQSPPTRFPSSFAKPPTNNNNRIPAVVEMPGDYSFPQPLSASSSPHVQPAQPSPTYFSDHESNNSVPSRVSPQPANDWRWSQSQGAAAHSSRPTSISSSISGGPIIGGGGGAGGGGGVSGNGGMHSPGLDHPTFSAELPTHDEICEEDTHPGTAAAAAASATAAAATTPRHHSMDPRRALYHYGTPPPPPTPPQSQLSQPQSQSQSILSQAKTFLYNPASYSTTMGKNRTSRSQPSYGAYT